MTDRKVLVIGLDCLTPQLLFERWLDELPTFKRLVEAGAWGRLRSVHPPITVPAWSCMMSGYQPAQLGLYGFRHRKIGTYDELYFAMSTKVKKPRVWDRLGEQGITSGVIGVPQTYPVRKVKGYLISGFLAPSTDAVFTFPDKLREELEDNVGPYILDVKNFRADDRDRILEEIEVMTTRRFDSLRYLMGARPTDFTMMVEMGSDRIHHAFWRFTDPEHKKFVPGNPYENSVKDYYKQLDAEIAKTLESLGDDDYDVFIVSDHGARPMEGGFAINQWLIEQGLLTLKEPATEPETKFKNDNVDWSKTKVWAWGGYYARIFINVEGREPEGVVPADELDAFIEELRGKLEAITGPEGEPMGNIVMRPSETAADGEARGDSPDLMVYFGDLAWRSIGSLGHPSLFVESNDTGPDDANHDHEGIFIHATTSALAKGEDGPGELDGLKLVDIGPTLMALFGVEPPQDSAGKPMTWLVDTTDEA